MDFWVHEETFERKFIVSGYIKIFGLRPKLRSSVPKISESSVFGSEDFFALRSIPKNCSHHSQGLPVRLILLRRFRPSNPNPQK